MLGLALLAACGRRELSREQVLPLTAGDWKLASSIEPEPGSAPEPLPSLGVRRVFEGTYTGPGTIVARVYEMTSSAGGLDAIQRWKAAADTVTFHHEQFFATVRWEGPDRAAVTAFVRAFEAHLRGVR
jgi:hypothetical protein